MTFAIRKGIAPRNIVFIPSPEIIAHTFKQLPTGGVQAPTANPTTNTTPNNTGETPASIIPGRRTGVKSKIAGLTSINVPVARIINITRNIIIVGGSPIAITEFAMSSGMRSKASIQINTLENAIIIMILALIIMDERIASINELIVRSLIIIKPIIAA